MKVLDLPQRLLDIPTLAAQKIQISYPCCCHYSSEFKVFANATYSTTYIIIRNPLWLIGAYVPADLKSIFF
jgi:hypothetical protein